MLIVDFIRSSKSSVLSSVRPKAVQAHTWIGAELQSGVFKQLNVCDKFVNVLENNKLDYYHLKRGLELGIESYTVK